MSSRSYTVFLAVLAVLCSYSMPAYAGGGIYYDNLVVNSGTKTFFMDTFDDGSIRDWQSPHDAVLITPGTPSKSWCVQLNCHGRQVAGMSHTISIPPGYVEAHVAVWLPPVEQQGDWNRKTTSFGSLYLDSKKSMNNIFVAVQLRPGEQGYRVHLQWNVRESSGKALGKPLQATTSTPVIKPGQWVLLTLRLDPSTNKATALLDNREQVSIEYDPAVFTSVSHLSLNSWLGDRRDLPEKR